MTFKCDECNGAGYIFWGDNLAYDVEKCECENFALGTLFNILRNTFTLQYVKSKKIGAHIRNL